MPNLIPKYIKDKDVYISPITDAATVMLNAANNESIKQAIIDLKSVTGRIFIKNNLTEMRLITNMKVDDLCFVKEDIEHDKSFTLWTYIETNQWEFFRKFETDIPIKISELENDSGFITQSEIENINVENTNSIDLDLTDDVLKAHIKTSNKSGNIIHVQEDGLYVHVITGAQLLFLGSELGRAVLVEDAPTERIFILPTTWYGANPGIWQEIVRINASDNTNDTIVEFTQGNRFSVKLWLVSEMAQNNVQVRIQAIDRNDSVVLASATTTINLLSDGITPIPVLLENIYQISRKRRLEEIDVIISIMPTTFGIQVGVISNPPDEVSYINTISTSGITETLGNIENRIDNLKLFSGNYEDLINKPNIPIVPTTENTNSISLDVTDDILRSNIKISSEDRNMVELKNDGIYVSKPLVVHGNLSKSGNLIEVPIGIMGNSPNPRVMLKYQYSTATYISVQIKATGVNVLIDLRVASQYDVTGVDGNTINNTEITSTYRDVDLITYNQSNEMHKIWLRLKDPTYGSNLWSLFEIYLFTSANGARTDILIRPVYENLEAPWG